jgi:hypothetical protein
MSILSSTNSGKQAPVTEEFLLSNGWKLSVDLFTAKIYRYTPKIFQSDKPLSITFNNGLNYYLYKGKYKNINIDFKIRTIGELQELISYYFNELKDPAEAYHKIKNNKNVDISFDYEMEKWVSFSTTGTLYKSYL